MSVRSHALHHPHQGYESTVITIVKPGEQGDGKGSKGSAVVVEDQVTIEVWMCAWCVAQCAQAAAGGGSNRSCDYHHHPTYPHTP